MAINKNSNGYTFTFAILMVVVVGTLLAVASQGLKSRQDKNTSDKKMINILSAIKVEATRENAQEMFDTYVVESKIISGKDMSAAAFDVDIQKEFRDKNLKLSDRNYPMYICEKNGSRYYVIPVVGTGLWGPIWGFVALESDYKTIYGATFDHKGETPGLGAEIKQGSYSDQYAGEMVADTSGTFLPIVVVKDGSGKGMNSKVDGITGGTITSKGVEEMTTRTLAVYVNYFNALNN
ncbi:MAG: NADH:ubiquinone reductase (Na(+)-transporting) subunit C [Flavobacteriales bacterium]|nr:NADH:ubiquinone reductase (Na(+)-transporting) subunit C [Flavobacteriales bacterium]MDG1396513.1 NADH:ubiquinone reductase (Na(+)-transporting) subunit C [Flavobacteriales bacterium]